MCRKSFSCVENKRNLAHMVEIHYSGVLCRNPFFEVEKCHYHAVCVENRTDRRAEAMMVYVNNLALHGADCTRTITGA